MISNWRIASIPWLDRQTSDVDGALGLGVVGDRPVRLSVEVVDDGHLEVLRGEQGLGDARDEHGLPGAARDERVWVGLLELREGGGQCNARLDVRADGVVRVGVEGPVEQRVDAVRDQPARPDQERV